MIKTRFGWTNFLIRLLVAVILVLATYNPIGPSYYHWLQPYLRELQTLDSSIVFAGVVLLIGWVVFLRATFISLGFIGTMLAAGFFASLIWLLVDHGLLQTQGQDVMTWLCLIALAAVLAVGLSWSHLRRRWSGQLDVDEHEE